MRMPRPHVWWFGAALLAAGILVLAYVGYFRLPDKVGGESGPREMRAYWRGEIHGRGKEAAAAAFRSIASQRPPSEAHLMAHAFGGALYDTVGIAGLAVCPSEFSQGCAHELIGTVIEIDGMEAIRALFATCSETSISERVCLHSIGHGILGFFGYDEDALASALKVCGTHEQSVRGSCADGVFMEYFLRFLLVDDDTAAPVRALDDREPYGPCLAVEPRFGPACAFEIPRWRLYAERSAAPAAELFGDIASHCSALPIAGLERACLEGLGSLATIEMGKDVDAALSICRTSTKTSPEYLYCVTGVVHHLHYWSAPNYASVCVQASLSGGDLAYCEAYARSDVGEVDALPLR